MMNFKQIGVSLVILNLLASPHCLASDNNNTSISDLPPDMLKEIFLKLDLHNLKSAAQVSKQFKGAACDLLTKEREAMEARKRLDAMVSEAQDIVCNTSNKKFTDDEIVKASKILLSINSAPVNTKLAALNTLSWFEEGITPDQDIEYDDLVVTLWDNNTFPTKDDFEWLRDERYRSLQKKAKEIAESGTTGLSQKSIAILKKYESANHK